MKNLHMIVILGGMLFLLLPDVYAELHESFDHHDFNVIVIPSKLKEPCSGDHANGIHKQYYNDGHLYLESTCVEGKREGEEKLYYPEGTVWTVGRYKNNELHGLLEEYDREKNLVSTENYQYGILEGAAKKFYPGGMVSAELYYSQGKKEGVQKFYYESGKLKLKENYTVGVLNGERLEYYETGPLKTSQHFEMGKAQEMKRYDENGRVIAAAVTSPEGLSRLTSEGPQINSSAEPNPALKTQREIYYEQQEENSLRRQHE